MSALISGLIALSCRRPWLITLAALVLCALAMGYAAQHFAMTTDTAQLISPKTAWRQHEAAIDAAFPQRTDQIVVVVDGATSEIAETATAALADHLAQRKDLVRGVSRPDGGPFFAQNGLLFLSRQEVADTTSQLISAQPVLGPVAADPSLRGVMDGLATLLKGVQDGQAKLDSLAPLLKRLADATGRLQQGKPVFFSWEALMSDGGKASSAPPLRHLLLVQAKLDYDDLEPGSATEDGIRKLARELKLDGAHGVRVRLTGEVPLADERSSPPWPTGRGWSAAPCCRRCS